MIKKEQINEIFEKVPWYYYGPLLSKKNENGLYAEDRFRFADKIKEAMKTNVEKVNYLITVDTANSIKGTSLGRDMTYGKFPPKMHSRFRKNKYVTRVKDIIWDKRFGKEDAYNTEAHFIAWLASDIGTKGREGIIVLVLQKWQYETIYKFMKEGFQDAAKYMQDELFDRVLLNKLIKNKIIVTQRHKFSTHGKVHYAEIETWKWKKGEPYAVA